jgi:transcriptional regulator with XRE-family HTH domain
VQIRRRKRRGRPSDEYAREDFRKLVCDRRRFLGISLCALAKLAGINRGTLSAICSGKRPAAPDDRTAILQSLCVPPEIRRPFISNARSLNQVYPTNFRPGVVTSSALDPTPAALVPSAQFEELIRAGSHFRARSFFSDSRTKFAAACELADSSKNTLQQARAASEMSWLEYEQGRGHYDPAWRWTEDCDRLVKAHSGYSFNEMVRSLAVGSSGGLLARGDPVSEVVSLALHIRRKILIELVAYHGQLELVDRAEQELRRGLQLDAYLDLPRQTAHDRLWQAILLVGGPKIDDRSCRQCLDTAADAFSQFPDAELGRAYALRARGIVCWRTSFHDSAREYLLEAAARLAALGDARALGPTFFALSKLELQGEGNNRLEIACRYALAGAVIHPHGFVLDHLRSLLRIKETKTVVRGLKHELFDGFMKPFGSVHNVLQHLLEGTEKTVDDILSHNLIQISSAIFGT